MRRLTKSRRFTALDTDFPAARNSRHVVTGSLLAQLIVFPAGTGSFTFDSRQSMMIRKSSPLSGIC